MKSILGYGIILALLSYICSFTLLKFGRVKYFTYFSIINFARGQLILIGIKSKYGLVWVGTRALFG